MRIAIDNVSNRLTMPAGLKALVIDQDSRRRTLVEELLRNNGYATAERFERFEELYALDWASLNPRHYLLVVCCTQVNDADLDQLKKFVEQNNLPILMMSEDDASESINKAILAGVNHYLVVGVQGNRIRQAIDSAVASHRAGQGLRAQIQDLKNKMQERIVVEKAKGLVSKNKQLDEEQAYAYLRDYAMKKGMKLVDVANMVIDTAELLDRS